MTRPAASRFLLVAICSVTLGACRVSPTPKYLVTAEPIDIGFGPAPVFCLAIDPRDPQGVWWWQPGVSGCESRSTGPAAFRADNARVTTAARGGIDVRFAVQTHSTTRPVIDVAVVVHDGLLRVQDTGAETAVRLRDALDLPETAPWRRAG